MEKPIKIQRDCDATLIPSGDQIKLIEGTVVRITQSLGGDFTLYVNGNLVKLSGGDADAIGLISKEISNNDFSEDENYSEDLVWERLRTCFDPEIPVNIVDLGLIYDLSKTGDEKSGFDISIKMTLTAPGCGMGPSIAQDVNDKVSVLPGVNGVDVEIVWDPIWDRSMMTEEAKLKLGMF